MSFRDAVNRFATVAARGRAETWPVTVQITAAQLTSITGVAATDVITKAAHGRGTGDPFVFSALAGGAGLVISTRYYVIRIDANTFKLAESSVLASAGTALDFTSNITAATGNTPLDIAKAPTKVRRENPDGVGWVQSVNAVFLFPASGTFVPKIGAEWEITASTDAPAEVGQRWRCFDFTNAGAGTEHRCVCFRLD